jgi:hypothetical protein
LGRDIDLGDFEEEGLLLLTIVLKQKSAGKSMVQNNHFYLVIF